MSNMGNMGNMSNSRVTIEIDREVAEFLDRTGEDAQDLLLLVGLVPGGSREQAIKTVSSIENWKKVREAIKAAGVRRDD